LAVHQVLAQAAFLETISKAVQVVPSASKNLEEEGLEADSHSAQVLHRAGQTQTHKAVVYLEAMPTKDRLRSAQEIQEMQAVAACSAVQGTLDPHLPLDQVHKEEV